MALPALAWAFVLGGALVVQVGINAALRVRLDSAPWAAAVSFGVGGLALVVLALATRSPWPAGTQAASAPWWVWTGGLLGAAYVASTLVLGPRLGAAVLTAVVVAGQMITALVVDHYGLVGFPEHPVTLARVAGAALVVAGVVLLTRG
jgi:transporter family-2 protein